MRMLLALFIVFLASFSSASEIISDDSLATGSLWQLSLSFSGSFDKAVLSIDSSDIIKAYYNSTDKIVFVDSYAIDNSKVNSYLAGPDSLKLVLYPLSEGSHVLKLSLFKDSALVEEKTKKIDFISSSSLISEIKRINEIYSELSLLASELKELSSENSASGDSIAAIRQRLDDLNGQISILNGALRENSRKLSAAMETSSELNVLQQKISEVSERVDKLSNEKAGVSTNGSITSTAFAVLGNAALPLGIIALLIAAFFIVQFIKGRLKGDSTYSSLDYPEPK